MVTYKKGKMEKTFDSEASINIFTGASAIYNGDFEYRSVTPDIFFEMIMKYPNVRSMFNWDDGTPMNHQDWIDCVNFLMTNFT